MMTKWEDTPFASMAIAAEFARKFLRVDPEPVDKPGFTAFVVDAGGDRTLVAQVVGADGQPAGPVKQLTLRKAPRTPGRRRRKPKRTQPDVPSFGEGDRMLTGMWVVSDYDTLEQVVTRDLGPSHKGKVVFEGEGMVVCYPGGDVYEYRQARGQTGVQARVLQSARGRHLGHYRDDQGPPGEGGVVTQPLRRVGAGRGCVPITGGGDLDDK